MRDPEPVVEAAEKYRPAVVDGVFEDAGEFFRQSVFLYSVMIVKARLGAPADMEGRRDVSLELTEDRSRKFIKRIRSR